MALLISRTVKSPHVAEAAFSMECSLLHWYELKADDGSLSNTVILGRINRFQTVSCRPLLVLNLDMGKMRADTMSERIPL